ncbi:MAG: hypothetical protein VYE22_37465 [Myxococcota bacterium]|nr:hypothetical protein [Myxococcota bacterium]
MRPRRKLRLALAGVLALGLIGAGVAFLAPWSRPCEEEIATAERAWNGYVAHLRPGNPRRAAGEVRDAIAADPTEALEKAESLASAPPPSDPRAGLLYREAMETLVLAQGACRHR